jgi:structural maintenance of chromosome 1
VISCDLFNKAFNHISERIDPVYKELTKGKAAPHGGVAYLSLEDSDVSPPSSPYLSAGRLTDTASSRSHTSAV